MAPKICKATRDQLDAAHALVSEYYRDLSIVVVDSRADLERYDIWLAWKGEGEEPVGCIFLRKLFEVPRAGEIKRMYVRPAARGCGLGQALLDELESYARRQGLEWLYLDTKDDLKSAISCYLRNGYTPCDRYNNNPQATIFMRKRLNASL